MKTSRRFRIAGLVTLLPLSLSAQVSWTGAGLDSDWATTGNWTPVPTAPTSDDAVTIDGGGHAFVTTTDAAANTLTIGNLAGSGGELTVSAGGALTVGDGGAGMLSIYKNSAVNIGTGGLAGTLSVGEVALEDSGPIDPEASPGATLATLAFEHTDDVTFGALLSGGGLLTKNGAGTLTLTGNSVADLFEAETFSGLTQISGGTLVLDVGGGYWDGDGDFEVAGSGSVLRIAVGTTLANDIHTIDGGTVQVEGALDQGFYGSTFTDATLRVLDGGEIVDGDFTFSGASTLRLDYGSVVSGGYFSMEGASTLIANFTGGLRDANISLLGGVTLSLGADEALDNIAVLMTPEPIIDEESGDQIGLSTPAIQLNGHNVTFGAALVGLGEIVNNSPTAVTVTIGEACGCGGGGGGMFYFTGTFSETSPTGKIGISIVGGNAFILGGTQTYTGPTLVDEGSALFIVNTLDADNNPVPGRITSSLITLRNGGFLGGNGIVDAVKIVGGGELSPGGSFDGPVAVLTASSVTIEDDADAAEHSFLNIDIYDADANLAPGVGVDLLDVTGNFSFSPDLNDTFTVRVGSLGGTNDNAFNFDPGLAQSWTIASIGGSIVYFDPSRIFVDASYFTNAIGLWTITRGMLDDKEVLNLNYAPIPEPAAFVLLGSLGVLPALLRRRRRARS